MPDLGTSWFILIALLLGGYAALDGFDLGVGVLHPFLAKSEQERRIVLDAIAPVWDGNEVWLLAGGAALFAAFPPVYATLFSGLYLPVMLLLGALILRAVSVEFRGKEPGRLWRRTWDTGFSAGSFVTALLLGVAAGNVLRGLPIGPDGEIASDLLGILNPFALGVGAFGLALFVLQGAAWLVLRTEGAIARRARHAAFVAYGATVVLWAVLVVASRHGAPGLWHVYVHPAAIVFPAVFHVALLAFPFAVLSGRRGMPFLFSSVAVLALFGVLAQGLHPDLLPALGTPLRSLTVHNAASSPHTLSTMLTIALVGVPLVVAYTVFIYWRFRGPVGLDGHGY